MYGECVGIKNEIGKERCVETYKKENKLVKRCMYESKIEADEEFGKIASGKRKVY